MDSDAIGPKGSLTTHPIQQQDCATDESELFCQFSLYDGNQFSFIWLSIYRPMVVLTRYIRSKCFGPPMVEARLGIMPGSMVLFKL